MLTAFLAGSGGEVTVPKAVAVVDGSAADEVCFIDDQGEVLVTFKRADVAVFSEDGPKLEAIKSAAGISNGSVNSDGHGPGTSGA